MAAPHPARSPEEESPEGTAGSPPGPVPGALRLAEPGQRLLARIVDTLIVGLPVVAVVRALVPGGDVEVAAPPSVAVALLLYEGVQLALWGRTVGKRIAGIEVVQDLSVDGRPLPVEPIKAEPPAVGEEAAEGEKTAEGEETPKGGDPNSAARTRGPGVLRSLLRATTYALPIAARPVPVFGVLAGVFWVANAGLMYEGTRRQALHDRLAGTIVVKRR